MLYADTDLSIGTENVKLNLGSLVKGFIVDKAVSFLLENGINSGFVNAGGDMHIFGSEKKIGIQHPRSGRSDLAAVLAWFDRCKRAHACEEYAG